MQERDDEQLWREVKAASEYRKYILEHEIEAEESIGKLTFCCNAICCERNFKCIDPAVHKWHKNQNICHHLGAYALESPYRIKELEENVTYPNIEAFYAENEERRRSGEADYGVWWTVPGFSWPKWRVSYIHNTGEVYAVQLKDAGQVMVLGIVPPDDDHIYYETLNRILEGWVDVIQEPGSLEWLQARLVS
jgi:hypothetical protein